MEKAPEGRFSADELAQILWSLSRGESVRFTVHGTYQSPPTAPSRRRPLPLSQIAWGVSIGLVVALGAAGVAGRLWQGPSKSTAGKGASPPASGAGAPTSPAATEPAMISFETDPPGAEVRIAGANEPLGTTPFRQAFPAPARSPAPSIEVELRLAGYETARITVSTDASQTISMSLTRIPTGAPRRPRSTGNTAAASGNLEKEATIDPFR
jgi:hypothetical protein